MPLQTLKPSNTACSPVVGFPVASDHEALDLLGLSGTEHVFCPFVGFERLWGQTAELLKNPPAYRPSPLLLGEFRRAVSKAPLYGFDEADRNLRLRLLDTLGDFDEATEVALAVRSRD